MSNAPTIKSLYAAAKQRLQEGQASAPLVAMDARVLLCHVLGMTHEAFILHGDDPVSPEHVAACDSVIAQRLAGRPVAKIIGTKEFYGRDFRTTDDTLDPRPDSETLIETVLQRAPLSVNASPRLLDLGTGTGCLVLTLLAEYPHATAVAVDQSEAALVVAQQNAAALGLADRITFLQSDWFSAVDVKKDGRFNVILSNPPYIPDADIAGLARDVRDFDPLSALAGGADGLDPYRHIIPQLADYLAPNGLAVFELGIGQDHAVADLLRANGFSAVETARDLAGIGRIVSGFLQSNPE